MLVRDYKNIDQYKIISIYLKIISKHSGNKHHTIAHATFKHDINALIIAVVNFKLFSISSKNI